MIFEFHFAGDPMVDAQFEKDMQVIVDAFIEAYTKMVFLTLVIILRWAGARLWA